MDISRGNTRTTSIIKWSLSREVGKRLRRSSRDFCRRRSFPIQKGRKIHFPRDLKHRRHRIEFRAIAIFLFDVSSSTPPPPPPPSPYIGRVSDIKGSRKRKIARDFVRAEFIVALMESNITSMEHGSAEKT